ncbi:hypothetical protein COO60DRAFT_1521497 [Scenedesmus sp. NREL 46B-D3]|nr:hypothetical protein COO60DRAFT_1521497 [Scenedesmus sp. NREL 46B-D3]
MMWQFCPAFLAAVAAAALPCFAQALLHCQQTACRRHRMSLSPLPLQSCPAGELRPLHQALPALPCITLRHAPLLAAAPQGARLRRAPGSQPVQAGSRQRSRKALLEVKRAVATWRAVGMRGVIAVRDYARVQGGVQLLLLLLLLRLSGSRSSECGG